MHVRMRFACVALAALRTASAPRRRGARSTSNENYNNSHYNFRRIKISTFENYDNYNNNNYPRTKDDISYTNYEISEYLIISIRMMHDNNFEKIL